MRNGTVYKHVSAPISAPTNALNVNPPQRTNQRPKHMETEERHLQLVRRASDRLDEIAALALATDSDFRVGPELKSAIALGFGETLAALVYPHSIVSAAQLVYQLEQAGFRWRLLGTANGSLLDDGQDFVGISLRLLDERIVIEGTHVRVHAGYSLAALVQAAAENGLAGLEGLAGLTGSVGSALRNVTGLIGRYIWSVVEEVVIANRGGLEVIPLRDAEERELFDPQDLILGATLKLTQSTSEAVLQETERARHARYAAALYQRPTNATRAAAPETPAEDEVVIDRQQPLADSVEIVPVEASAETTVQGEQLDDWFGLSTMIRERVERELYAQFERMQPTFKDSSTVAPFVRPAVRKAKDTDREDDELIAGKFE